MREWQLVCEEVTRFIAADEPAHRPDAPQRVAAALSLRCVPASPLASIPFTSPFLRLQVRTLSTAGQRTARHAAALHYKFC